MEKVHQHISTIKNKITGLVEQYPLSQQSNQVKLACLLAGGVSAAVMINSIRKRMSKPKQYKTPHSNKKDKKGENFIASQQYQEDLEREILKQSFLNEEEALYRSKIIRSVDYTCLFILNSTSKNNYRGTINISLDLDIKNIDSNKSFFIDFIATEIFSFKLNDALITDHNEFWKESKLYFPIELIKDGKNSIEIIFINEYNQLGNGLISYQSDENEDEQYVYTMTKPFFSHLIYPCFDQPDIKASYKMLILAPEKWKVVSNQRAIANSEVEYNLPTEIKKQIKDFSFTHHDWRLTMFKPTIKLSPYNIGFGAGTFDQIDLPSPSNLASNKSLQVSIFGRKTITEKLKQQADNISQVCFEGIKFFEEYFDVESPTTKFDLIFLPFIQQSCISLTNCPIFEEEKISSFLGDSIFQIKRSAQILQSIAQIWIGGLLSPKWWNQIWVSESLSLFLSYYCLSKIGKQLPKSIPSNENSVWDIFNSEIEYSITNDFLKEYQPVNVKLENATDYSHFLTEFYSWRGAGLWKQLYCLVDQYIFNASLKIIAKKFLGGTIITESVINIFDEVLSNQKHVALQQSMDKFISTSNFDISQFNLAKWVEDQVEQKGVNEIEVVWEKDPKFRNMIKIKQSSGKILEKTKYRNHRLKVALINSEAQVYKVKDMVVENQKFTNLILEDLNRIPEAILLNYDGNAYTSTIVDKKSLEFLLDNFYKIKDQQCLLMVVNGALKAIKMGNLSAEKLIKILCEHISLSKGNINSILLQQLLNTCKYICQELTPNSHRNGLMSQVFRTLKKYIDFESTPILKHLAINYLATFATCHSDSEYLLSFFNDYLDDDDNYTTMSLQSIYELFKTLYLITERKELLEKFKSLPEIAKNDIVSEYYSLMFQSIINCSFDDLKQYIQDNNYNTFVLAIIQGIKSNFKSQPLEKWFGLIKTLLQNSEQFPNEFLLNLVPNTDKIELLMDKITEFKQMGQQDTFVEVWIQYQINKLKSKKASFMAF